MDKEVFKAQSEVIGVVLLLAISITAISAILLFGTPTLQDLQERANQERMTNEFSLLDASISSSALGSTESSSVGLNAQGGTVSSNPNASWMRVDWKRLNGSVETLANITMGNIKYENDRNVNLAFEGGGVWRNPDTTNNYTSMVSSPEFRYEGSTLTLPAFNITNNVRVGGELSRLRVESSENPELVFPNSQYDNPLQQGNVTITVKSEYYLGWEDYFDSRTIAAIENINDEEKKVTISLEIPQEIALDAGLMYGTSYDTQGSPTEIDASPVDVALRDASEIVDPEVNKCFPNPYANCENIEDFSGSSLNENDIYFVPVQPGKVKTLDDYAAPDGNVTIVTNGSIEFKNHFAVGSSPSEPVRIYVDGDLGFAGDARVNTDDADVDGVTGSGEAKNFVTYVSGGLPGSQAGGSGNAEYTGVIYTPGTSHGGCGGGPGGPGGGFSAGTPDFKGAVIADSFCIKGNAKIEYDPSLGLLDLSSEYDIIRFLHITENEVRVSS